MTDQKSIPCLLMRGGTSKGPFFLASDLPQDLAERDRVLLAVMGSPDMRQIDGLGGADSLTSKVAIVSPSQRSDADVDYLFAQVSVSDAVVDTAPSCGNMLAGVGPFAIERGLVPATGDETTVKVFNVNTSSLINATVRTRDGGVIYTGDFAIDGVPGTASPVRLDFMNIVGSKTGSLLPTGSLKEEIDGVEVTLIDVSVPMMIVRAADMGKSGYESPAELDADKAFFAKLEAMRRVAGLRMGLGDVTGRVLPKVSMLAAPREAGHITARYFVPHKTHAAFAVTGALCVSTCVVLEGSVSDGLATRPDGDERIVAIEHASGSIEVSLKTEGSKENMKVVSGGVIRTARKIIDGVVFVPR